METFDGVGQPAVSTIYEISGEVRIERTYDGPSLARVARYEYTGDRLAGVFTYSEEPTRRWNQTLFAYDESGRLERTDNASYGTSTNASSPKETWQERFEYDETGRLTGVYVAVADESRERTVYERRRRGASPARSANELADRLVMAIRGAVADANLAEPVWCLALHYSDEDPLPPTLVFGAERERRDWGADIDLLNPAEWEALGPPRRLVLEDVQLREECARFWDLVGMDATAARKLLNEVARRMNDLEWGHVPATTGDFFVYAVDLEGEATEKSPRRPRHRAVSRAPDGRLGVVAVDRPGR